MKRNLLAASDRNRCDLHFLVTMKSQSDNTREKSFSIDSLRLVTLQ